MFRFNKINLIFNANTHNTITGLEGVISTSDVFISTYITCYYFISNKL